MQERLTPDARQRLLRLAARAVRATATGALPPEPDSTSSVGVLAERRGAFVTLTRDGRLRGCVGRVEPIEPLDRTVIAAASAAARDDPRFDRLDETELDGLRVDLSVLELPAPVEFEAIEPGRDGVILEVDGSRSLFLPQVATRQGWDRDRLVAELARKAGVEAGAWRRGRLLRFRAESFGERLESLLAEESRHD